jgi:hypothetical protein
MNGSNYGFGILNDLIRIPIDFECAKVSKMEALQDPVIEFLVHKFRQRINHFNIESSSIITTSKAFREVFSYFDAGIAEKVVESLNRELLGCGLNVFRQCRICRTLATNETICSFCSGQIGLTARSDRYASRYQAKYSKPPKARSITRICYCNEDHSESNTVTCSNPNVCILPFKSKSSANISCQCSVSTGNFTMSVSV